MGFIDDIFDTKICDEKDTKINYTMTLGNKKNKRSKDEEDSTSLIKNCATWIYINSVDWCITMKGSHLYKRCLDEIFDNLASRKGVECYYFPSTLTPDWGDYWYDRNNHKHYNKQQLRKVEKEFDRGRTSEELVMEMLNFVWYMMIDKNMLYQEIDDNLIYKLSIRFVK